MNGLLLIDKPTGWTSHDVVAKLRKVARTKKIGHTGTLDPDATGLLPITIGYCTKLAQYLILDEKTYDFELELGSQTTTDDASGEVIATSDCSHVTEAMIHEALAPLRGEIMQQPPRFSALKIDGKRAYDLARQGGEFELPARPVTVYELTLHAFEPPRATLTLRCSSGTYVRSIVRDLGLALGTHAHTTMIRRMAVGRFRIEDAVALEALNGPEDVSARLLSGAQMVTSSMSAHTLSAQELIDIGFGKALKAAATHTPDEHVALLDADGQLVAIAQCVLTDDQQALLQPRRVLTGAR